MLHDRARQGSMMVGVALVMALSASFNATAAAASSKTRVAGGTLAVVGGPAKSKASSARFPVVPAGTPLQQGAATKK